MEMKKIIGFISIIGLVINSYSQLQYFFPDSNNYFSVSYMKFWFQGDTIFDNLKYKKVYMQYEDSIADFGNARYFAAIREDTVAEKVYFYYEYYLGNGAEYLLYDFSVNVGETVSFYTLWGGLRMQEQVVISIDSIFIDNHYRKKINFIDDWGGQDSWIEGIGSIQGVFFAGPFDIADLMDCTQLLCVHIDGELIYRNPDPFYDKYNCYIPNSGVNIDENRKEILKIYPTITDDVLYIETDENIADFDYKIINIQGQVINYGMLTSNIINVSNLNKGFYLIMVSDKHNKKNITVQKFIKN
jgi:hypothetical protein